MDLQKDLTHENDPDSGETAEWLDALKGALAAWGEEGPRRVHHLIEKQIEFARIRAGMRWQWCCAPEKIPMLAGISRRLRRARRCTKPALITSGARHPKPTAEI